MTERRTSSRPSARITCPGCGLDQPLSMDCAGCRRSFSLDELNAARQGTAAPAPTTAAPAPEPSPFAPTASPETASAAPPLSTPPPPPPPPASQVFADEPASRDEPVFRDELPTGSAGNEQVFRDEPPSSAQEDAAAGQEPEFGSIYDPSKAIHSQAKNNRYHIGGEADLSGGELVQESIQATLANFLPVAIVTVFVSIPAILYTVYFVGSAESFLTSGGQSLGSLVFHLAAMLAVSVLCQLLGSAALTHVIGCWLRDDTVVLADSLGVAFRSLIVLVILVVVQSLGIMVGILFLILPGIILAIGWSVSVPAMVIERLGVTEALGRSWQLTSGNRLSIFWAFFILNMINRGAEFATGFVMSGQESLAVDLTLGVVFTALQAVLVALIYFKLRAAADNVPIDDVPLTPPAAAF